MSIKRYFCNDSDGECRGMLYEHPNGVCVRYSDYQKLEKTLDECIDKKIDGYEAAYSKLEAERDVLKESHAELMKTLEDIQGMDDSSLWEQNDTVSYIAKFARQAINKAREVMDEM